MEKEVIRKDNVYLTCPAKPGRNLIFLGKNAAKFVREFNEKVKDKNGECVRVEIKLFRDGNYEFKVKNVPLTYRILNRSADYEQLDKTKKEEARQKERKEISQEEFQALVQEILPSLNTSDLVKAQKTVLGTVRSLGVKIKNQDE